MGKRRNNQIDGQFNARLIEMMESPAYRVLSLSARRVLDRICIELAHHGGNDNGRLPVTYEQFVEYGVDRDAVAPNPRTRSPWLYRGNAARESKRGRISPAELFPDHMDQLQEHSESIARMAQDQDD